MAKTAVKERGDYGERCAQQYLSRRGYKMLCCNWRGTGGELDIVASRGDIVAFVEVKARTLGFLAPPASAVNRLKRQRIVHTAIEYLEAHPLYLQPRFDVCEVILAPGILRALELNYYENAFSLDDL